MYVRHDPAILPHILSRGPHLNMTDSQGESALFICAQSGSPDAVSQLMAAGATVRSDAIGAKSALWAAIPYPEVVQTMVEAGADIEATTGQGESALLLAASEGHSATVEVLLAAGADVEVSTPRGRTALSNAAFRGHTDVVRQLLMGKGFSFSHVGEAELKGFETPIGVYEVDAGR